MTRRHVLPIVALSVGLAAGFEASHAQELFVPQVGGEAPVAHLHSELTSAMTPLFEAAQTFHPLDQLGISGAGVAGTNAAIAQYGFHNQASIDQSGALATATITQLGAYNRASIVQN